MMKIMVFLHGTAIMHRNGAGRTREERIRQCLDGDESLRDFASYVPVDSAVAKLCGWSRQGAQITYLSSHRKLENVEKDQAVLQKHGFPDGQVLFRQAGEQYRDVVEAALPDILIEDDAKSIGGEKEMAYPHVRAEFKTKMKSIVLPEFGGLDHLPDDVSALMRLGG